MEVVTLCISNLLQILYGKAATPDERREVKQIIHMNVIQTMKTVLGEAKNVGTIENIMASSAMSDCLGFPDDKELDAKAGSVIATLWKDPGVQKTWDQRASYQVVESISKFFDDVDRLSSPDYMPNDQDMLLARVRTSGIVTESYVIDGNEFEMYDVGGQRNERKKWIHCFDNVTAVLFVAAISEYDQKLFEDASTNRMLEALELYREQMNNRYFERASVMLFLNKKDLFMEKVGKVPISDTKEFSDYTGGSSYEAGCEYFTNKFNAIYLESCNKFQREADAFYCHITCATDTNNVKMVFNVCKDVILKNNLKDSGFL